MTTTDSLTEWPGGDCPVASGTPVRYRYRNGVEGETVSPELGRWNHSIPPFDYDIVAYRVQPIEGGMADAELARSRQLVAERGAELVATLEDNRRLGEENTRLQAAVHELEKTVGKAEEQIILKNAEIGLWIRGNTDLIAANEKLRFEIARLQAQPRRVTKSDGSTTPQAPPGAAAMEWGQLLMQELSDLGYRSTRSDVAGEYAAIFAIEHAVREARAAALEEAAQVADSLASTRSIYKNVGASIRALAAKLGAKNV